MRLLRKVKDYSDKPIAHLITSVIILSAAGNEILTDAEDGFGSEHGVAIYAVLHIIRTFPEVISGVLEMHQAAETPRA